MTNITTAMGQAYADSIPMLVISSVQSRDQLGGGRGKLHELPNQAALVAGVAAFSQTLMSADDLPQVLARAFAVFDGARPRPVHIEIPLDVLVEPADHLLPGRPVRSARAGAAPQAVAAMAERLAMARRPLILAGGGALAAGGPLALLAEHLQAPVALTINARACCRPATRCRSVRPNRWPLPVSWWKKPMWCWRLAPSWPRPTMTSPSRAVSRFRAACCASTSTRIRPCATICRSWRWSRTPS